MPLIWRIIMAVKRALPPTHPGEILREDVLPALNLSVVDAATKLGITRQTLHRIIARRNPRPVTPEMAVRLCKPRGHGPPPWGQLQNAHDPLHARAHRRIPPHPPPSRRGGK